MATCVDPPGTKRQHIHAVILDSILAGQLQILILISPILIMDISKKWTSPFKKFSRFRVYVKVKKMWKKQYIRYYIIIFLRLLSTWVCTLNIHLNVEIFHAQDNDIEFNYSLQVFVSVSSNNPLFILYIYSINLSSKFPCFSSMTTSLSRRFFEYWIISKTTDNEARTWTSIQFSSMLVRCVFLNYFLSENVN